MKSVFRFVVGGLLWSALFLSAASQAVPVLAQEEEAAEAQGKPGLSLSALPVYVQGFPVVVRLVAKGPFRVPRTSLFSNLADVDVTLSSKADGKTYSIRSATARGAGAVVSGPMGRVDGSRLWPPDPLLPKDAQRSLLLDLCSIRSWNEDAVPLPQMPPGRYELQMTLRESWRGGGDWLKEQEVQAPSVEIEIRVPSPAESHYLTEVKALGLKSEGELRHLATRPNINWAVVLDYAAPLTDVSTEGLGEPAKAQVSYHLLQSRIITFPSDLKALDEKQLGSIQVPSFLEAEKKSLMLELQILAGKEEQVKAQIEALLGQEPALAWRIQEARQGKSEYLSYRKQQAPAAPAADVVQKDRER